MNRAEEAKKILWEVLPRLEALHEDAEKEIRQAREEARKNLKRHEQASGELAKVEAEVSRLSAEREGLPDRAFRAGMDEDFALEDELKERYKNIKPAIESLAERRDALRDELRRLAPRATGHPSDAKSEKYASVASVTSGARAELQVLRDEIAKALDAALDPVTRAHEDLRGQVWQWSYERDWANSPAGGACAEGRPTPRFATAL